MQSITLIGGAKAELTLNRWAGSYKDTPVYKPEIEATGVKIPCLRALQQSHSITAKDDQYRRRHFTGNHRSRKYIY